MNKILFAAALMTALIPFAAAQDNNHLPQASLNREADFPTLPRAAVIGNPPHRAQTPPSYCKPCLFYAGDFDSNASDANGLANELDVTISTGAAVYAPFIVPKGKTWTVTGLFTDNFLSTSTIDPKTSPYEIRKDIPKAGGSGGKLVCHGKGAATLADTFGQFPIYAVIVGNIKGCRLPAGKYWMSVIPYCTNTHDSACENGWRAFEANDDGAMAERYGPLEPANDSFFNSVFFGANWEPSSEQQSSSRFSDGVEGTEK